MVYILTLFLKTLSDEHIVYLFRLPPSVWPHLFCGAGHEKRRGEQLQWSLAFKLYIGSFPCAQLPGPVHTQLGWAECVYI